MKRVIVVVAALAAVLALGGCGSDNAATQSASSQESSSASSAASASQASNSEQQAASSEKSSEKAKSSEKSSEKAEEGSPISKSKATKIIEDNGYGNVISLKERKIDGVWYWVVTASIKDGSVHEYTVDPKGKVKLADERTGKSASSGSGSTANNLSKDQVETIVWEQGLGQVESMKKVTYDDGVQYWQVVATGSNGKSATYMVDPDGNVSNK